jgi:hypothetical protein
MDPAKLLRFMAAASLPLASERPSLIIPDGPALSRLHRTSKRQLDGAHKVMEDEAFRMSDQKKTPAGQDLMPPPD